MRDVIRILVLAGTQDARLLCARLACDPDLDVTASLAGATANPLSYDVPSRTGGFGGPDGLLAYLKQTDTHAVINATHPFAAQMTRHAISATTSIRGPYLRLLRAPWTAGAGEQWTELDAVPGVADHLKPGEIVLLAIGKGGADTARQLATARGDVIWILRTADPLPVDDISTDASGALTNLSLYAARPPFALQAETEFLRARGVTALVTKNAGGDAGRAKLEAARAAGIAVYMVRRPEPPPTQYGETVATCDAAEAWVGKIKRTQLPSPAAS